MRAEIESSAIKLLESAVEKFPLLAIQWRINALVFDANFPWGSWKLNFKFAFSIYSFYSSIRNAFAFWPFVWERVIQTFTTVLLLSIIVVPAAILDILVVHP